MLQQISWALASVATCGSITELSRICAHVSVPPRFGVATVVAAVATALAVGVVAVGAHAAASAAATVVPPRIRNRRRPIWPGWIEPRIPIASPPEHRRAMRTKYL